MMKKMMLMIFAGFLSINAHSTPIKRVELDPLTMINLNQIQENRIFLSVSYPGKKISGSCSIVIRARNGIEDSLSKLAEKLQFTRGSAPVIPDSSSHGALVFALLKGAFVDSIDIETKDGKSIAENVSSVFPAGYNDVGVLAGVCA